MTTYMDKVKKSAEITGLRQEINSLLWQVKRLMEDATENDFKKFRASLDSAHDLLNKAVECFEELP
jgi:archaellum component FlaC